MPSHHTPPSGVSATFVKIVFFASAAIALGFVLADVPGATPKNPGLGIDRAQLPVLVGLDPRDVVADRPDLPSFETVGGMSIAKFVLPQALGNAAVTYVFSPCGLSTPTISMCSAIQPSSRAMVEAMRRPKHFLPSSALPP